MLLFFIGIFCMFTAFGIISAVSVNTKSSTIFRYFFALLLGGGFTFGGLGYLTDISPSFTLSHLGILLILISLGTILGIYLGYKWKVYYNTNYPHLVGKVGIIGFAISRVRPTITN